MPSYGDEKRAQEAARRERARKERNDIGKIPPVKDPERRAFCETRPAEWLRTYMPERFFFPFSETQLKFIELSWNAIQNRSYQNVNAYRSFGKTSILTGLMMMSHCIGWTRHFIYVTAEGGAGKSSARFIGDWLFEPQPPEEAEYSTALAQDYPEIAYPISLRDNVAQKPLEYGGYPCKIVISPKEIVFPTIADSPSSGSRIAFASILSGSIRGSFHYIRGVGAVRPDGVMIDDVQSDGTSKSEIEVQNIMDVIKKTIGGLAGYKKDGSKERLTILSALTQNQPNDVACRIIDELPEYCTVIYRFLRSVPSDFAPWRKYRDFRREQYLKYKRDEIVIPKLAQYYTEHRTEIENGVEADNLRIKEAGDVSAIHFALNFWSKSEAAFWCELQNDSVRAAQESAGLLVPIVVSRKKRPNVDDPETARPLKRYWIPNGTDVMTAHIDAGEHYLNYQVTAFEKNFAFAHVVDFGIWPEQNYSVISKSSFRRDLQDVYEDGDKFCRLRDATVDCLRNIFEQQYFDADGKPISVDFETDFVQHARAQGQTQKRFRFLSVCGVDCSDGEMENALWEAVDRFHRLDDGRYFGRAIPCYGDEAGSRLMRYYDLKSGEWRRGRRDLGTCDWIENPVRSQGIKRRFANIYASLLYDANTAKTRRNSAWLTQYGKPGAATLFDWDDPDYLTMFAEHQCAEEYVESKKSNLLYLRWHMKKPRFSDNEFLDTDAGTWALASYVGVEYPTAEARRKPNFVFMGGQ